MYFYGQKKKKKKLAKWWWWWCTFIVGVHRQRAECPSAVCGSKHPLWFQSRDTVSQGSDQASRILSSYLGDGSFLCGWSSQIMPQQNVPVSRSFLLSANLE